jgi:hypothetical protein
MINMPEYFSIFYLSILAPLTNLIHGIIGGIFSAQFGWYGKNDSVRWIGSYTLIGIFCAFIVERYIGRSQLIFHSQFELFTPLSAVIGLVWSGIFKYRVENADWRILALFPIVGFTASILYQVRSPILLFAILGMLTGAIIWYLAPSRLHSTIVFAGIGIILAITLLPNGISYVFGLIAVAVFGLVGWLNDNQTLKWTLALFVLGILAGSIISYIVITSGFKPAAIGGILGGLVGFITQFQRRRILITFTLFGGVFFCAIKAGLDYLEWLRWDWFY